jgi:ketosteroid isomerase-like protein
VSQQNVEIVERLNALYNARDFPALAELMTPDFVWDMSRVDAPVGNRYAGLPELRGFIEAWSDSFAAEHIATEEIHDAGDQVVVVVHQSAQGRSSGIAVEQRYAMVWTLHGGRASRMDMYANKDDALKAVGLED